MSQELSPKDSRQELDNKTRNNVGQDGGYHQLNAQHNTAQQFNSPDEKTESEYNSDTQRNMLNNTQRAFNEQREQYAEQAFHQYDELLQQESSLPPPNAGTVLQPPAVSTPEPLPQYYNYENTEKNNTDNLDEIPHKEFKRYVDKLDDIAAVAADVLLVDSKTKGETPKFDPDNDRRITMGAETPDAMKLSQKIYKDRIKKDKIHARLKETRKINHCISIDKSNRLNDKGAKPKKVIKTQTGKKRLYDKHNLYDSEGAEKLDRAVDDVLKRKKTIKRKKFEEDGTDPQLEFVRIKNKETRHGRLKHEKEKVYQKQTRKAYDEKIKKRDRNAFKNRVKGRLMFSHMKSVFDDDSIQQDETAADMSRMLRRGGRAAAFVIRSSQRSYRNMRNPYERLKYTTEREQYHIAQRQRLYNKNLYKQERAYVKEAATKEERKRRKKEMQKARVEREGNFFIRTLNQHKMNKKSAEYKRHKVKRTMTALAVTASILGIVLLFGFLLLIFMMCITQGAAEYYAEGIVQADYGTITDATEYFKNLEADLEEYVSDKTTLESDLRAEHGSDIYEFDYDICDFGFSANTILAYIAAKYNEFTLDDTIKADLKEVLQEMYVLTVYIQMEDREIDGETEQKKICYVTLSKTELEKVVENRLTEDQLRLYQSYKLTTGGQQVYGPVMWEDWTNLISSNYGDRIHPITKVRKTHKGVDIAVPTGTKLYSAVKGTVTVAHYSETAGNMITVKNSTGWTVTFMHMDSIAVSAGQDVEKGDFIGYSGNTGNSTGPHLHLQVNDASGNTINPIFIIPQTCAGNNDD